MFCIFWAGESCDLQIACRPSSRGTYKHFRPNSAGLLAAVGRKRQAVNTPLTCHPHPLKALRASIASPEGYGSNGAAAAEEPSRGSAAQENSLASQPALSHQRLARPLPAPPMFASSAVTPGPGGDATPPAELITARGCDLGCEAGACDTVGRQLLLSLSGIKTSATSAITSSLNSSVTSLSAMMESQGDPCANVPDPNENLPSPAMMMHPAADASLPTGCAVMSSELHSGGEALPLIPSSASLALAREGEVQPELAETAVGEDKENTPCGPITLRPSPFRQRSIGRVSGSPLVELPASALLGEVPLSAPPLHFSAPPPPLSPSCQDVSVRADTPRGEQRGPRSLSFPLTDDDSTGAPARPGSPLRKAITLEPGGIPELPGLCLPASPVPLPSTLRLPLIACIPPPSPCSSMADAVAALNGSSDAAIVARRQLGCAHSVDEVEQTAEEQVAPGCIQQQRPKDCPDDQDFRDVVKAVAEFCHANSMAPTGQNVQVGGFGGPNSWHLFGCSHSHTIPLQ